MINPYHQAWFINWNVFSVVTGELKRPVSKKDAWIIQSGDTEVTVKNDDIFFSKDKAKMHLTEYLEKSIKKMQSALNDLNNEV